MIINGKLWNYQMDSLRTSQSLQITPYNHSIVSVWCVAMGFPGKNQQIAKLDEFKNWLPIWIFSITPFNEWPNKFASEIALWLFKVEVRVF